MDFVLRFFLALCTGFRLAIFFAKLAFCTQQHPPQFPSVAFQSSVAMYIVLRILFALCPGFPFALSNAITVVTYGCPAFPFEISFRIITHASCFIFANCAQTRQQYRCVAQQSLVLPWISFFGSLLQTRRDFNSTSASSFMPR